MPFSFQEKRGCVKYCNTIKKSVNYKNENLRHCNYIFLSWFNAHIKKYHDVFFETRHTEQTLNKYLRVTLNLMAARLVSTFLAY